MNDAISRETLEQELQGLMFTKDEPSVILTRAGEEIYNSAIEAAIFAVRNAPALDVQPEKHAHWIHGKGRTQLWHCSACGRMMIYNPNKRTYNIEKKPMHELNRFCRSCGARMDEKED